MSDEQAVPVFIPPLAALLLHAEKQKGSPLTESEVLAVRDNGTCARMSAAQARALAERRGYDDIDPEDCWAQWQRFRAEVGSLGGGNE